MKIDDSILFTKLGSQVCSRCRHFRENRIDRREADSGPEFRFRPTCNAFPYKIPDEIWYEQNDHTMPYPGDQGIQFEDSGVHPPRSTESYYKGVG